jgi:hypothetical protein
MRFLKYKLEDMYFDVFAQKKKWIGRETAVAM